MPRIIYEDRKLLQYVAGKRRNAKPLRKKFGGGNVTHLIIGGYLTIKGNRYSITKKGLDALVTARIEVKDEYDFARH